MIPTDNSNCGHYVRKSMIRRATWLRAVALVVSVTLLSPLAAQERRTTQDLLASESRAAGAYTLEKSYDDVVCADILQSMNKQYWMPRGLRMPSDYGETETHYYLGTNHNVRWSRVELQFNERAETEIAQIDIFNDGQTQNIIRFLGTVSSHQRHRLLQGRTEGGRWVVTEIGFHPSRERQQRLGQTLSTAFDFSFVDVIRSRNTNYVLLKPSRDVIPEPRIFVLRAYGSLPNRGGADYELLCALIMP